MQILAIIFVGLFVGAVARIVMPGKDPGGLIVTLVLGVAGSLLAGMLGWSVAGQGVSIIASVIGALILLALYRLVTHRRLLT